MKPIEIVCHKGANEYAPENTYAAAKRCIEWGVDYVEIDVNRSRDGVHYVLHGPSVEETTNGKGTLGELSAAEIDQLDAGSWFHPQFAQERVPRLEPFLRWIKGKAKVFLDVKSADLRYLVGLIYEVGLEKECFFWFGKEADALAFRELTTDLALKVNVATVDDVVQAAEIFHANLVEVRLKDMSQALVEACRRRNLRIMVYHPEKDPEAFRRILVLGADLINLDHADLFQAVARDYAATQKPELTTAGEAALPKVKRVVLFMLDGCHPDALAAAETPAIDRLRAEGAWTFKARSVMPSITLPCHTSIFYSAMPDRHGVTTNDWTPLEPRLPSLIEVISDAGYETAAYYTWEQLRDMAPPGTLDTSFYRRYNEGEFDEIGKAAAESIGRLRPTFAFVYMEATDACGHRYGWMSPSYLRAVTRSDAVIEQVMCALADRGELEETMFIVMADHGGHGHVHGTDSEDDMTIPWIVWGPGVRRNHQLDGIVRLMDVAPTVLHVLGLPVPAEWQGRVVDEIFI